MNYKQSGKSIWGTMQSWNNTCPVVNDDQIFFPGNLTLTFGHLDVRLEISEKIGLKIRKMFAVNQINIDMIIFAVCVNRL